jgi:quercetin dioxygenase-like cupin family protein
LRAVVHPNGVTTEDESSVVYDVGREQAHRGAVTVDGPAIVWDIDDRPDGEWLVRCDRVDFPPGGVAYRHTHPGPGIRVLLKGQISIETRGDTHTYGPLEQWFEEGPEPVYAAASDDEETAFVRVMLVPAELAGQRTIRYVDPEDEDKSKLQRATIYFEHPLE